MSKKITDANRFSTQCPELVKEWHPTKNGDLTPDNVTYGSRKNVWWQCENGHEWQKEIVYRYQKQRHCPICKQKHSGSRLLSQVHPELAKEWHPTKNGDLTPDDVTYASHKIVWWQCEHGHEWQKAISFRHQKHSRCPICFESTCYTEPISITHPQFTKYWHPTKNDDLTPNDVTCGSSQKVWWRCDNGHEWQAKVNTMVNHYHLCPECQKETKTSFPQIAIYYYIKQYFPDAELNNHKMLNNKELDIWIPSIRTAIEYDGYVHSKTVERDKLKNVLCKNNDIKLIRIREPDLPILNNCTIINRSHVSSTQSLEQCIKTILAYFTKNKNVNIQKDYINIITLFNQYFKTITLANMRPLIAQEWHPTKNGDLTPQMISNTSGREVWWLCPSCNNEYQKVVSSKSYYGECPSCHTRHKSKSAKSLIQNIDTGKTFKTFTAAAKEYNIKYSALIKDCCLGRTDTVNGYHWCFVTYQQPIMTNEELQIFINNLKGFEPTILKNNKKISFIKTILNSLGYDKQWLNDTFKKNLF